MFTSIFQNLIMQFGFRKINGSYNITVDTVKLLKSIVSESEWKTAQ